MKFVRLFIGLILFVAIASSCNKSTPTLDSLAPGSVVVAFGDSLTYGTGVPEGESYPSVLESKIGMTVINAGIPGETSLQGLARLAQVLDENHPQLLILCHGGNDLLRKMSKQLLYENLQSMIKLAQAKGIDVILLGVPEPKLMFMESDALYVKLARLQNIPIETNVIANVLSDNHLKSDAIHPNKQGYQLIAEAVYSLMKRAGSL